MPGNISVSLADVSSDTIAALWVNVYSQLDSKEVVRGMVVCKTFKALLPSLITQIEYRVATITQRMIECLSRTFLNLKKLRLEQKDREGNELLEFSGVHLPELRCLRLSYCPLKSIEFNQTNTPQLQYLYIENAMDTAAGFELDLPKVKYLTFKHVNVSVTCSALRPCIGSLAVDIVEHEDCCALNCR